MALCPRIIILEKGGILYDGSLSKLVEKHAGTKVIRIIFERPIAAADLAPIGKVISQEDLSAVIEVPRKEVSRRAAKLLQNLPVADLTIEEVSIDEIVRNIFTRTA